jgi:hypothetical protein
MFIVGVSNQNYIGVTVATKAISNAWVNFDTKIFPHVIATEIKNSNPDLIIIGGWSVGFKELVDGLKGWPILVVWHGTQFHDDFFDSEKSYQVIKGLYMSGKILGIGFAHPSMAEYEKKISGIDAYFLPHSFKQLNKLKKPKPFNIHVVGIKHNALKNGSGQFLVAQDFARNNPGVTVSRDTASLSYAKYTDVIKNSALVLHMSHIECYPNTIQEAWSVGVPCIFSPASYALIKNPAIECAHDNVRKLMVKSSTEPFDLYKRIHLVHSNWDEHSESCYAYSKELSSAADKYTKEQLEIICESFTSQRTPSLAPRGI